MGVIREAHGERHPAGRHIAQGFENLSEIGVARHANQLCWAYTGTSSNACASAPAGATTYSHDKNGNLATPSGSTSWTYDALNRATTIAGTSLGYLSPSNAELVSVGTTTLTNNLLGVGSITSGGSTSYYGRTPDGALVVQRGASKTYAIQDRLGSTIGLLDTSGATAKTYTYDPDGNTLSSTGSGPSADFKYAGGYALPVAGTTLYHFGARYYDPNLARWTQPDPLQQYADLASADRYSYVGGDPGNGTDPAGTYVVGTLARRAASASDDDESGGSCEPPLEKRVVKTEFYGGRIHYEFLLIDKNGRVCGQGSDSVDVMDDPFSA